jgi:hypothetical protein
MKGNDIINAHFFISRFINICFLFMEILFYAPQKNDVNDFKYESIFPIWSCLRSAIYYSSLYCVKFVPLQKF